MNRNIKITTNPVANNYSAPHERIIEYSVPDPRGKGEPIDGLISFAIRSDGTLAVNLYRHDIASVEIIVSGADGEAQVERTAGGSVVIGKSPS